MAIDPNAIADASFSIAAEGYDIMEVRLYLAKIADAVAVEQERRRAAEDRVGALEAKLRRTREAAEPHGSSLTSAAALKERMLAEATERAEEILRETYQVAETDPETVPERVEAAVAELVAGWEGDLADELELGQDGATRYQHRSAQLPRLGSGASRDVLSSVKDLRSASQRIE